jgi:hypothetical protein
VSDVSIIVHNERVKLRASTLNTMATSCFSIGVLGPIAASFYNITSDHIPVHTVVVGIVLCFGTAFWLHQRAWGILEGLKQ